MVAVVPEDETGRLAAVRRYDVLDTPPDGAFDRITALAARLLGVPIAIVSIVDTDRIWFASRHGLDADQVDREPGLCASAILTDEPWLVTDARNDPRTLANSLVAGSFGLQFYAGVPLTTHDGHNLGTLCAIDRQPRPVAEHEVATLSDLAAVVMDELELRRSARVATDLEAELRERAVAVAHALQHDLLPRELPAVPGVAIAARYHVADRAEVGGDFYDVVPDPGGGDGCALVVGDACGKGTAAAALTGTARWALRTAIADAWSPAVALQRLNDVLVQAVARPDRYCTVALTRLRRRAGGATLTVALGGHPPPLVLRGEGIVEPVGRVAPIVGWSSRATYGEVDVELSPGDVVVLHTDGLTAAVGGPGDVDGIALQDRLRPLAGRPAVDVAARLDDALPDGGPRVDDAAFLVVEVT